MLQHVVCRSWKPSLKFITWLNMFVVLVAIIGCGGDDKVRDFVEVPDVTLSSLAVTEGGQLYRLSEAVSDFDKTDTGPYTVTLTDDTVTSITLQASLSDPENNTLSYVIVARTEQMEDEIIPASSGEAVSLTIRNGVNLIYARVTNNENEAIANYVIHVYRTSDSARLINIIVEDLAIVENDDENRRVTSLPPNLTFDKEVTSYSLEVNENLCNVSLIAPPENRQARVTVDGNVVQLFEVSYFNLDPGVTVTVPINVLSENGASEVTYTVDLTRRQPTAEDLERDARLRTFDIEGGRPAIPFLCDVLNFSHLFPNNVTSTSITPTLSAPGSTMTIGNAVRNEDGLLQLEEGSTDLYASENDVALVPGETYAGSLLSDLQVGDNYFVIRVTAANETSIETYLFNAIRTNTNGVYVSTAEELQQALMSAQPNDEIILAPGDYEGVAGVEQSGHAQAHFYSAASGTAATEEASGQPIVLRGESSQVRLVGSDQDANSVLLLEGSNWVVENISFAEAQNGLVLNGASNILLRSIGVLDVGERGIVMQNGSSNNVVRGAAIDRTGRSPQVRDGISEIYGEAIVVGGGETPDENNAFRYVSFGRSVLTEAIDLKANAVSTSVQFNSFFADNTLDMRVGERSLVNVDGSGDILINFNEFAYDDQSSGEDDISSVIKVGATETASLEIYQNNFDLDDQTIPLVSVAGLAQVNVADNVRKDGGQVSYVGNVNQSFATPSYQIQSIVDESKCLAEKTLTITQGEETVENDTVLMTDCADDAAQLWQIVHDANGFIMIVRSGSPEMKLSPGLELGPTTGRSVAYVRTDGTEPPADVLNDAFFLRWFMLFEGDLVQFINRSTSRYLTEVALDLVAAEDEDAYVYDDSDNVLTTANLGAGGAQVFRLVRQQ